MIKNPINTPSSVRRFIQGKPGSTEELFSALGEETFNSIINPRHSRRKQQEIVWDWADQNQIPWRDLLFNNMSNLLGDFVKSVLSESGIPLE